MEFQTMENVDINELKRGLSPKDLQLTPKSKSPKVQPELKCTECDFTTIKKLLFKKHCIMNHSDKIDPNSFCFNQYKCDFCEKVFKDPIQLSNHKNVHLGLKPYKCVECEHMFTTRGELIRHTRYKHTLERPHKCTICDYSSVELSKLKRHIRVHTDERPYLCPYCDYASRDTFKLKRHIRVHTGEKPYECPICKTCFNQSNSLKVHMKCSHTEGSRIQKKNARSGSKKQTELQLDNTASIKPSITSVSVVDQSQSDSTKTPVKSTYFLSTDDTYYSNENYLKNAQKSPVDCDLNSSSSSSHHSSFIQTDVILNEETNIFSCLECSMKFTSKEAMDEHHVKHTGERPYKCDICNMRFGQKFALRSHIKSHDEVYTEKLKIKLKSINESTASTTQKSTTRSLDINRLAHTPLKITDAIETQRSEQSSATQLQQTAETIEHETSVIDQNDEDSNISESCLETASSDSDISVVDEAEKTKPIEEAVFQFRVGERKKLIQSTENSFVSNQGAKKNQCEFCPKVYLNKKNLEIHIKKVHSKTTKLETKTASEDNLKAFITRLDQTAEMINAYSYSGSIYEKVSILNKDESTTQPVQIEITKNESNNSSETKSENFVSIYDRSEKDQKINSSVEFTLLEKTAKKKKASWNKRTSHQAQANEQDQNSIEPAQKKVATSKKKVGNPKNIKKTPLKNTPPQNETPKEEPLKNEAPEEEPPKIDMEKKPRRSSQRIPKYKSSFS